MDFLAARTNEVKFLLGRFRVPGELIVFPQPDAVRRAGVDVQGGRVDLVFRRQDYPLQYLHLGAHASTPPLSISAPPSKCGRILLSNMDRAEPIAMCMSRYL